VKQWFYLAAAILLSSCGYRYSPEDSELSNGPVSISVPYIPGDADAIFNNELVYQLGASGQFVCVSSGGDYVLQTKIISDTQSRIGFRYDRDNVEGSLEKNLLGVEDRRVVKAEIVFIEAASGKILMGPVEVSSDVDYDYTDPGSPRDLLFNSPSGSSMSIMQFSLGQLDSYEGAYDSASKGVYRKLAEKITEGLIQKLLDTPNN
jgi:hypothetical protein